MRIELKDEGFDQAKVEKSIRDIISGNRLLSMATVDGEEPHINTAFYCFDNEFNLYILTPPDTRHGQNLEENSSVAVDIYDIRQEWADDKQGLQLFGECRKASAKEKALRLYSERFTEMKAVADSLDELEQLDSVFYLIDIDQVKVFDEPRFGTETWVEARIK